MLFQAFLVGLTPRQRKFKLYPLALSTLWEQGGQIGRKRVRVHKWLADNDVPLVQTVALGTNLSGLISEVKLSPWVKMTNTLDIAPSKVTAVTSDADIDAYLDGDLDGDQASNLALFGLLYPDFQPHWTAVELYSRFDRIDVDVKSLKSYIVWISTEAKLISAAKKAHAIRQARLILSVTRVLGGAYLQRKKPSEFGRMYYEGISVQSVNRELRRAMLGNCWEYDIRSSVVAWKMGWARHCIAHLGINQDVRKVFPTTLTYLEDKADFMRTVRAFTFANVDKSQAEFQNKLLKQAFTAISFGARAHSRGWQNQAGQWTNPALVHILKNTEDRDRFLNDSSVQAFIREQNTLDDYLVDLVQRHEPQLLKDSLLTGASGRPAKAKVVAYLYQHGETQVMDVVRQVAAEHDRVPLANVHDAIFFKRRLGADLKWLIEDRIQKETGNPYWSLSPKEHLRYEPKSLDAAAYEQAHKAWIEQEEADAKGYYGGRAARYTQEWWAEQDD